MPPVIYEQAAYGSFAFREGGYALLANSPGCRPEWLAAFIAACQKFGEPAGVAAFSRAIFSLRLLADGPWAIVGVGPSGRDDRGRPGALAFHGLFVEEDEFRKVAFDPFAIAPGLRFEWTEGTSRLGAGSHRTSPIESNTASKSRSDEEKSRAIAGRLMAGRRVAIESSEPIEVLAREVWAGLPEKIRKTSSVATWAFSNANRFDLVAVPRLEAIEWDASHAELPEEKPTIRGPLPWKAAGYGVTAACVFVVAVVLGLKARSRSSPAPPNTPRSAPAALPAGPERALYRGDADPSESLAVSRALAEFAARFGIPIEGDPPEPSAAMIRLADRLRYRGALLGALEQARLAGENAPGRSRALAWDAQVRRFAPDRPLPPGFAQGPLRWQLDTFAWTFHLDPDARLAPAEVPRAMADALTLDEPIGANPLAPRYPALAEYVRFLARLPRR